MEDIKGIILAVQENPCLWDKTKHEYRNKFMKENAWNNIGNKFGKTGNEIKQRWTCLRDKYCRELNKQKSKSGDPAKLPSSWPFYHLMDSFLHTFMMPRKTLGNLNNFINEEGNEIEIVETDIEKTTLPDSLNDHFEKENNEYILPTSQSSSTKRRSDSEEMLHLSEASSAKKKKNDVEEEMLNLIKQTRKKCEQPQPKMDDCEMFLLSLAPMLRMVPNDSSFILVRTCLSVFTETE